ncbi:heavy metal translocating P-type ATPase [Calycomorphotria hydatis]|uniref:Copper-exporting P-type ATPase A n=1 Tax=Calycomorphotria hydatis TaxID=2528027 RepID=A0A517T3P8_9PLAN|nr:heavy metal translocating P-type ATPase [Calycomorphotria hydatis]QDT62994.1 Copper-exporting P-type ATPase A [Calycomorphotria hydatis]
MATEPILHSIDLTPKRSKHDATLCTHCGQSVPIGLVKPNQKEQFCCQGCETAYHAIQSGGLGDVYELRTKIEGTLPTAAPTAVTFEKFDEPAFHEQHVRADANGISRTRLYLENVHCAACVGLIEKLPRLLPGVLEARVNLSRSTVDLMWAKGELPLSKIAAQLADLGYVPHPVAEDRGASARKNEDRQQLVRLAIAGACAGNTMLIAICLYAGAFTGMEVEFENYFRWVNAGLGVIAVVWPGAVFFRGAWASYRTGTPHMDLPVALGLSVGTVAGLFNTFTGQGEVYFDCLATLVFLLLVGRYIQFRQQRHAADRLAMLQSLTPRSARLITEDGIREVPAESLSVGDLVEVRAGELIPADGTILEGRSTIDEALLTGESVGVAMGTGDTVAAGTTNLTAALRVQVTAVGELSRVGQLMRLVEEASLEKPPLVQLADRIAGYFVVIVTILAGITAACWWPYGWNRAVDHAVALLIVACPCALGLATPLAIAVAQGRAARRHILIKSGDVVERLARPGRLWLDKTGTITEGHMTLRSWHGPDDLKPLVAALERQVAHPIAQAIVEGIEKSVPRNEIDALEVSDVEQVQGSGIRGQVGETELVIGNEPFVRSRIRGTVDTIEAATREALDAGYTPILIASDGWLVAVAAVGDSVRPDARESIERLQSTGWDVGILSGDHPQIVETVASQVNIALSSAHGGVSPEEKLQYIKTEAGTVVGRSPELPTQRGNGGVQWAGQETRPQRSSTTPPHHKRTSTMVGDGVNDSAAMAAADVGIAVHGGAEVSLQAANVYLGRPGLKPLVELIEGSRRTLRVIHTNFAVSLGYNLLAVILAMGGYITPLVAAILMPVSSLTVLTLSFATRTFGGSES